MALPAQASRFDSLRVEANLLVYHASRAQWPRHTYVRAKPETPPAIAISIPVHGWGVVPREAAVPDRAALAALLANSKRSSPLPQAPAQTLPSHGTLIAVYYDIGPPRLQPLTIQGNGGCLAHACHTGSSETHLLVRACIAMQKNRTSTQQNPQPTRPARTQPLRK